ncbi:hypothetical protein [Chitinophaga solisilvae]|uniref:Uncharacterized protein n=1 Tax=Chitinophaga solisilvae TaxID=1233460 RepID=A0A3S1JHC4_9BACT|nr:hypothetical protein [Chitinophaga solisilvae]NSL90793.1 hypothetical protein [Chitinophaga solisilvae]
MRKATAIFLFLVYLLGTTDANQLLRLPLLIEHYQKHQQEDPHITLTSFLKLHYIDEQPFDDDYQQDMQLPFKSPDAICMVMPTLVPAPVTLFVPVKEILRENYLLKNEGAPMYRLPDNVFQPPKMNLF